MLEHQQPLDSALDGGASQLDGEPGFRVQLAETGLLLLQSAAGSALQEALTSETALRLPPPGETCIRGNYALLWLTPAEWLLECPLKDTDALHDAFTRRLAGSLAAVTEVSDALVCFGLSGARAIDVLASGCSLNQRADIFPAGRVARTSLAGIPAIIRKTGEPHDFRCLVERSFARHMRDWLLMTTR